ncbi:Dam family site-specific DNA-(adenine-N6)-methyltransferase [Micromonospora sp. NPDC048843]|uniref:DNA adenine methylase n=1 Tax=Micromonospora sp. NPDC048843 TaxID=3155389 RepID=UPI0033CA8784
MGNADPSVSRTVRPFLRWVGGKRWLIPQLSELIGDLKFRAYHEPFLGGASAFFGLLPAGPSFLSDLNSELIHTYATVRDDPAGVSRALKRHRNTEEYYYCLRAAQPRVDSTKAARFIFLNHTSYNGVYRVNRQGGYNVPFGRRDGIPRLPSEEDLEAAASRLQGVTLSSTDFAQCIDNINEGDLVFLDPPYTVAHNHNGFVKYNQKLFSWEDQVRLSELVSEIRNRGAFYILTNAAHLSVAELFEKGDRRIETSRRNAIGGLSASRGTAIEYLFTNVSRT